ncbi:hypothetical protein HanIR_Chr12g0607321 [Helianthus annuus]|nr:hypothetical protein HanIR_Chr12g0607321 [Helianthus annuus]
MHREAADKWLLQKVQVELEREREARKNIESRFEQFQQEREKERADQAAWQKTMEEKLKNIGNK